MLVLALVSVSGCADELTAPDIVGEWGGTGLHLVLRDAGGTLEYDCAYGSLAAGWTIAGRIFEGVGEHVQEHGGPIREGEVLPARPASYRGVVNGGRMTLTVTLTDSVQALGTFDLRRGSPGLVRRCL